MNSEKHSSPSRFIPPNLHENIGVSASLYDEGLVVIRHDSGRPHIDSYGRRDRLTHGPDEGRRHRPRVAPSHHKHENR
jgi:hypothetical protein